MSSSIVVPAQGTVDAELITLATQAKADIDGLAVSPLNDAAGTNIADSSVTIAVAQGFWRKLPAATLGANRSTALSLTGATAGVQMILTRLDVSDYTWTITDAGPGTPTLFVFPGGSTGSIRVQSDGTNWFVKEAGVKHGAASVTIPGTMSAADKIAAGKIVTVSKAVTQAAIAALGATMSSTIDFAGALPAGATYLGSSVDVTAVVDNVGDTASATVDLGIKTGDTDAFIDGASLNAVAKVNSPQGVVLGGTVEGGITPMLTIAADVNLSTITKGGFTAYLTYLVPHQIT